MEKYKQTQRHKPETVSAHVGNVLSTGKVAAKDKELQLIILLLSMFISESVTTLARNPLTVPTKNVYNVMNNHKKDSYSKLHGLVLQHLTQAKPQTAKMSDPIPL